MPTLSLRPVGMSYLIEGLEAEGVDFGPLRDELETDFGAAVAPLGGSEPDSIAALLLDRRATPWDDLRARLADWVRGIGGSALSWDDGADARSVLHFDLGPT